MADLFDGDEDDFDFGGDDGPQEELVAEVPTDAAHTIGVKRGASEMDVDEGKIETSPSKKVAEGEEATRASLAPPKGEGTTPAAATATAPGSVSREKPDATTALQASAPSAACWSAALPRGTARLDAVNKELDKWRDVVQRSSLLPADEAADPEALMLEMRKQQAANTMLTHELEAMKRRENVLLLKLLANDADLVDLKMQVRGMTEQLRPNHTLTRQLLLDPAVHSEFTYLKRELQVAEKKAKELHDDLAAVQFTPHSKNGKMLMAKCRALQEENEEIGREASEGKMHEVENKLALQRHLNAELKRGYQELQECVDDINEEAERLQHTVYMLQRQVQEKDADIAELKRMLSASSVARESQISPREGRQQGRARPQSPSEKGRGSREGRRERGERPPRSRFESSGDR
eukprot:jgi/Mesen1/10961/ME000096S10539